VAVAAALAQPFVVPVPKDDPQAYLRFWISVALVCVGVTGGEMAVRCRRAASRWMTRQTLLAVEQFLPSLIAGASVTLILAWTGGEALEKLPGLWGVIFSLGLFASARILPRPLLFAAFYYLGCGLVVLALARGNRAFAPWAMALTFGGGQMLTASILYATLERQHVEK
jgi:hypothetical protein